LFVAAVIVFPSVTAAVAPTTERRNPRRDVETVILPLLVARAFHSLKIENLWRMVEAN
jgi:hypothetical protein